MALTDDETTDALLLLDLPVRTDVTFYQEADRDSFRLSEIARRALGMTNTTQETAIRGILAVWQPIRYDADAIKAEGLDSDPSRTTGKLKNQLAKVLGINLGKHHENSCYDRSF